MTSSLSRPAAAGPILHALLLLAFTGSSLVAQVETAPPEQIPPDSVQLVLERFQTLQQEVGALQQEVMAGSPGLQERQAQVSEMVQAAVAEIDPELRSDLEARMPGIQQEAEAAQAAGDTAALQTLEQEYVALRTRAQEAEQEALERPAIATEVDAFQDALRAEMRARDPEIAAAFDELERLGQRLDATLGG